jgi:rod shape determining protein RodA
MFDRRLITHFDWFLLLMVILVAIAGVVNIYSATHSWGNAVPFYQRQICWLGGGLVIALLCCLFDYRWLRRWAWPLYCGAVLLLAGVFVVGKVAMGARRWIHLGFFNLQPSEIVKIVIIVILARYFSKRSAERECTLADMLISGILLAIPCGLILKQPDLGTSMLVLAIGMSIVLFNPIRWQVLALMGIGGAVTMCVGWSFLHDYQKSRIHTFLNPESDPLRSGYHIIQSKIAVGDGGFWGRGFLQGSQAQLSFLPERHTDFAFSVFAEEWGFIGSAALLLAYLLIVLWGIFIAYRAPDLFGRYLAIGVTAMLFWHITINLGMVIGLLPVVGVPLPLFSYGGTSMITTMVGVGLLLNVSMRRFIF